MIERTNLSVNELCSQGYRRISLTRGLVARLDRPNWLQLLSQVTRRPIGDFLAKSGDVSPGWVDHYLKAISSDVFRIAPELSPDMPTVSSFTVDYVPRKGDIAADTKDLQSRMVPWFEACFSEAVLYDLVERNHRFLEESLELVQTCGLPQEEAHRMVDYVYGRPKGEVHQEIGGVMMTLAALCFVRGYDFDVEGERELVRAWGRIERIREKQKLKPKMSDRRTRSSDCLVSPISSRICVAGTRGCEQRHSEARKI